MESEELIERIAQVCDNKQAKNIKVLDMDQLSLVADYFLICHGMNTRQVQAIAQAVKDMLEEDNMAVTQMEGLQQGRWVIIEVNGILCHIFEQSERFFYNLERLWGDAREVEISISQEG